MIAQLEHELGRCVFREANDAFFIIRPDDLHVCEVNPAAQRLTGLRRKQLLTMSLDDIVESADESNLAALVRACQTTAYFVSAGGFSVKTRAGGKRAVHLSVSRIHTEPETLALLIVRDISRQKQTEERAAQLLYQVISAQEDERSRLARELHDATGQSLTFLLIGLHTLLEADMSEAARSQARELHRIVARTLDEVQHLARALRPPVLDDLGLVPALERHVADCRQLHGLDVSLHTIGVSDRRLPPPIETTLYRIAQEAITNVAKHAQASTIVVSLKRSGSVLNFTVEDDGRGFDAASVLSSLDASRHLGLSTMRERAVPLGGSFTIDSKPGRGTRICVQVPVHDAE